MPFSQGGGGGGAPTGAASGDLGGNYPGPTVTGGTHLTAASVAIASLADPTTGKVIGSSSNAAAAVFPPGFEIGYDQITSQVNVVSTTEATGTTVIAAAAHTFDGTAVMVEFFSYSVGTPVVASVNDFVIISLFEAATQIGRLAHVNLNEGSVAMGLFASVCARYRFTPTAASHTYTVTAHTSSTTGTPFVGAGAAGTGVGVPAFVRFTKV